MNLSRMRPLVGSILLRRGILISALWTMYIGLSGGGRRSGNFIVLPKLDYFGGVFWTIRSPSGKIYINGVLMVLDGVRCAGLKGKR